MAIEKITEAQRKAVRIVGLNDVPGLSAEQMQQRFDGLGNLALDKLNELIDLLNTGLNAGSVITTITDENGIPLDINAALEKLIADIDNLKVAVASIDSSLSAIIETETF